MSLILVFILKFSLNAFSGQCEPWTNQLSQMNAEIQDPALLCRATCSSASECIVRADPCGRRYTINSKFENEVKEFANKIKKEECTKQLTLPLTEKAECLNKKCQIVVGDCKSAKKFLENYFSSNFSQRCSQDRECSYILKPNENCLENFPVNSLQDNQSKEFELNYIREKYINSCIKGKVKRCEGAEVPQCFNHQCILTKKIIPFVSYLNFEGTQYTPNYKSRTEPLLIPDSIQLQCKDSKDCAAVAGICSQYAVTIGKKGLAEFTKKLKTQEEKVACPKSPAIVLPIPDCVENYCVFREK